MLSPIYLVPLTRDGTGKLIPSPEPIPGFRPLNYSRVQNYTLVSWEIARDGEAIAGENLWLGEVPLATTGGQLELAPLMTPDFKRNRGIPSSDIWETIPQRTIEIPTNIAIALRDIKNLRWLE